MFVLRPSARALVEFSRYLTASKGHKKLTKALNLEVKWFFWDSPSKPGVHVRSLPFPCSSPLSGTLLFSWTRFPEKAAFPVLQAKLMLLQHIIQFLPWNWLPSEPSQPPLPRQHPTLWERMAPWPAENPDGFPAPKTKCVCVEGTKGKRITSSFPLRSVPYRIFSTTPF